MESDAADRRPTLDVSERNRVTYSRLASLADYDRIMEVFQGEIDEAAGRPVRLVVDRNVDVYELRRFAVEQVVLERSFRGLTDLDEIRVDRSLWDEAGPEAQVLAAFEREPGATGSLLWYNPRLLSRGGAHAVTVKSHDPVEQEYCSPTFGRLGVSFISLHEKGHQVAQTAADKKPVLRAALSWVTLATATALERQELERRAAALEAREKEALRTATGEQAAEYERKYRRSRGYTDRALNESPEEVRTRLLDGLSEKYRGCSPMNEMSRMHVEAYAGGYAARNHAEQEAQSVAIVATYGLGADKVSRMVNRMIMAVHEQPADVRLSDYLACTDMIKAANEADRARDARAFQVDQVRGAATSATRGLSDASTVQAIPRDASRADLRHPSPGNAERGRTRGGGPEVPGPANGPRQ